MQFIIRLLKYYQIVRKIIKILNLFKMSDKGYLSSRTEKRWAKALDGFFDFSTINKEIKILWGVVNIKVGNTIERNDYRAFLWLIALIDDAIVGKNPNPEIKKVLDDVLGFLEAKDIAGFNEYLGGILAGKINIPLVENDKAFFIQTLSMFNALLNFALTKVDEAIQKAEEEEQSKH